MSDFENVDVLLGTENVNLIEKELANTINGAIEGSTNHCDTVSISHPKENSSWKKNLGISAKKMRFPDKTSSLNH